MKLFFTAYYEFLKNLRDIKMLVIIVISPVLVTFILGTVLQSAFSNDIKNRIPVGYVNGDSGITGKEFDKFLRADEVGKRLEVSYYGDKTEGEKSLEEGKIDVLIYLPKDLSQNLLKGDKVMIQIWGNKNVEYIESLVRGFTTSFNAVSSLLVVGGKPAASGNNESNIKRIFYTKDSVAPRAMDYYAVLTMLQMLVIGAVFGVFITARNYGSDIHIRVHSLPVSRWVLTGGRILGSTLYLFLGAIINILCTKLFYKVNWNGNLFIILAAVLVFCFISVGIGILIGIFIPSFPTAMMLVVLLMIFFGTFSGSVSPESTNDSINFLIPNYHAKILLFGTIYGYSKVVMLKAALWLLGTLAVIYGTAAVCMRRAGNDNI